MVVSSSRRIAVVSLNIRCGQGGVGKAENVLLMKLQFEHTLNMFALEQ